MVDLQEAIRRALARAGHALRFLPTRAQEDAAAVLVESLRPLSPEQRRLFVRNSSRFHTVAIAEQLLRVAAEDSADGPALALVWLDLLDVVLDSQAMGANDVVCSAAADMTVRVQALRAVTFAKLSRYDDADLVLRIARAMEVVSPLAEGELDEAEGVVAAHRQQLDRALTALERAHQTYAEIGDKHLAARAVLKMSFAYGEFGDYLAAVDHGLRACNGIDPARDRRLMLVALFNLARYLRDAGRLEGALSVLERAKPFFAAVGRHVDRLNLRWFGAGVLAQCGRYEAAVAEYEAVLEAFAAMDHLAEVGAIAIEAAEAYQKAGQVELIEPLLALAARTMTVLGRSQDATAAWIALSEAAARRAITAAVLEAATRSLSSFERR